MKRILEVLVFATLLVTIVAAAQHVTRLEAREEIERAKQEALEAKEWAAIVETEAAELMARSRREPDSQADP